MCTFIILNCDCGWLNWSKFSWGVGWSWELKWDGFIWFENVIISNVDGTTYCLICWLKHNCSDSSRTTNCGQFKVASCMDTREVIIIYFLLYNIVIVHVNWFTQKFGRSVASLSWSSRVSLCDSRCMHLGLPRTPNPIFHQLSEVVHHCYLLCHVMLWWLQHEFFFSKHASYS